MAEGVKEKGYMLWETKILGYRENKIGERGVRQIYTLVKYLRNKIFSTFPISSPSPLKTHGADAATPHQAVGSGFFPRSGKKLRLGYLIGFWSRLCARIWDFGIENEIGIFLEEMKMKLSLKIVFKKNFSCWGDRIRIIYGFSLASIQNFYYNFSDAFL